MIYEHSPVTADDDTETDPDFWNREIPEKFNEIDGLFDHSTGHDHSGADKGALIPAAGLAVGAAFVSGMIIMWSGLIATIPAGWYLCNGSNGTPDLRDKFIVGAKQDGDLIALTNVEGSLKQTGGQTTIPAHVHSMPGLWSGEITLGGGYGANFTGTGSSGSTGSTGTGTVCLPPYYALAFIMKS